MENLGPYLHKFDAEWEKIAHRSAASLGRRLGMRLRLAEPVLVLNGREIQKTELLDLSSSGCALVTQTPGQPGEVTVLTLDLGGQEVTVPARCVRHVHGGAAYEFLQLSDCDRLSLAEHLDRCSRRRLQRSAATTGRQANARKRSLH